MRSVLCAWAVLAVATLAPSAQSQSPSDLSGVWTGWGLQTDARGARETWSVRVIFEGQGKARVDYPSLNCGGSLARERSGEWRETITYGACVDGGRVRLRIENRAMFLTWNGVDTTYPELNAVALLYPEDRIG